MSQRIRLVVSDVDGTIVSHDKSLLPGTIAAAGRLKEAGIHLALVSSRPPRGMAYVYETLHLSGPMASFNGGIISHGVSTIAQHLVPEQDAALSVSFFEERGIAVWLFTREQWILKDPQGDHVDLEIKTVKFDPTVVEDFVPYLARCGKIVGVSADFAALDACEPALNTAFKTGSAAHKSQNYYLDVNNRDANKGTALRAIANWYGFDVSEVASIGDMTNDVPMFQAAGLSIAMGNAPVAVAAEAKTQTGPNTGSGWADAIDRYILPSAIS
jgi:Cof subfamily protein (haloacid dehalogenase superfamily)